MIGRVVAVAALVLLTARAARADRAVAVVCAADAAPLVREAVTRLMAELDARGFPARAGPPLPGRDRRSEIVSATAVADVRAALGLWHGAGDEVEIWGFDARSRRLVVLPVDARPGATTNPAMMVAVRAVELLRASVLEIETRPATTPAPPARRLTLGLAAGALSDATGESGTAFAPVVTVAYGGARLGLRLTAFGGGSGLRVTGGAGSAAITPAVGVAELLLRLSTGRVSPHVAAGGGVQHLTVAGDANAPYQASTQGLWTVVGGAGLGLSVALGGPFALSADVRALAAATAPRVQLRDEVTGALGRVAIHASLGFTGAL